MKTIIMIRLDTNVSNEELMNKIKEVVKKDYNNKFEILGIPEKAKDSFNLLNKIYDKVRNF